MFYTITVMKYMKTLKCNEHPDLKQLKKGRYTHIEEKGRKTHT